MPNYDSIFNPMPIPDPLPSGKTLDDYKLGNYDIPILEILSNNVWVRLPEGKIGQNEIIETVVNQGRASSGLLLAQRTGRDLSKIDNYVIPMLYAHEWKAILDILDTSFQNKIRYYDMQRGKIERTLYCGNRTATVYAYKQDASGDVEIYQDCKVNFIDVGKQDE